MPKAASEKLKKSPARFRIEGGELAFVGGNLAGLYDKLPWNVMASRSTDRSTSVRFREIGYTEGMPKHHAGKQLFYNIIRTASPNVKTWVILVSKQSGTKRYRFRKFVLEDYLLRKILVERQVEGLALADRCWCWIAQHAGRELKV